MRLNFGILHWPWLLCLIIFVGAVVKGQDSEGHCEGSIEWVNGTHKDVYDVGVLAIRGFDAAYTEFNTTFSDYLTATAGARFNPPVQFRLKPLNFLLLFSDTASAEVDFFYVNPSAFSCIESEFGASSLVSQISKRKVDDQVYQLTKFGGVIFTLANATIDSVYDLKDRSIAAASISGLGSGQMQFRVLQQAGLSYINDPSQVVFTSNQGKVVNGVLNGEFEVGFVRTDQLERSTDANGDPIDRTQIKIIDPIEGLQIDGVPFPFASSTPLYAEWNLAALPHVSNDANLAVQDALLSLQAHANVGDRLVECYNARNCTGDNIYVSQEACYQSCITDFMSTSVRCDTTPELALLASEARNNGKYTGWRSTLSYMELRNMQEETGFINKNPETGKMQCIRSANIYDAIVCPAGHFKKSEGEVAAGCSNAGLECKSGFQCVCKPCVRAFDVDIFSVQSTTASFLEDVEERQSGCPKFSICGSTEQTKAISFAAVDNKKRDDLSLIVRLHDEFDYRDIKAQRVEGSNYTYAFDLAARQVGVLVFEVFADGEQVPESPLRVSVDARDCAYDYGDGLRLPDENGNCVCSSNSIKMGGRCVSYAILIPAILVPFFLVGAAAIFLYVEKKKNQADSVWAVKVSELVFDDPPTIIGRGTFGLVLLAEYRGTQVAVKRVIPPKFELKNPKKGEDSVHRASMLGGGDYEDVSGEVTGRMSGQLVKLNGVESGMESCVSRISEEILKIDANQSSRSDFTLVGSDNLNAAIEAASTSLCLEGGLAQENFGPNQQGGNGSTTQRRRHSIGSQNSDQQKQRLSWAGGARRASFDLDANDKDEVKLLTTVRRASFVPPLISSDPSSAGGGGDILSSASLRPMRPERRRSALDMAFDFDQDTSEKRRSSQVDIQEECEEGENDDEIPTEKDAVDLEAGAKHPESVARNHGMSSMTMSVKGTNSVRFAERGLQSGWGSAGMLSRQSSDFSMTSLTNRQTQLKHKSAGLQSFNRNMKKIFLFGQNDEYKKLKADFITEMRHLSKLRHPCITTVMGAVISNFDEPMLVMEYMDHGSLYDILHNETMVVDGELLLPILRDIAQGVRFLHTAEPQVIHGDLKAQNVLVDGKFRAKVADFGLSQKKKVGATGTPYWMAPELLRGESQNNASSDVYSFGIILYEVYSRKDPYDGEDYREVIRSIADPVVNKRPPVPKSMSPTVVALMAECLSSNPAARPTFEELDQRLKRLDVSTIEPGKLIFSLQRKKDQMVERTSQVFEDLFPRHVAQSLREGRKVEPEHFECVTIFFSDIVGFTDISTKIDAAKVSDMLDRLYIKFDDLSEAHDVFKIETIGDAYICVTNLVKTQSDHAARIARFSIDAILKANETLIDTDRPEMGYVNIRVGFHTGSVVANVVGSRHPKYTIFGDTVNTASRMESNSIVNRIQCSDITARLVKEQDPRIPLNTRGAIHVKGKGDMVTFWVNEKETKIQHEGEVCSKSSKSKQLQKPGKYDDKGTESTARPD